MKTKIYIGSNEILGTPTTMNTIRYTFEGTGNPVVGTRFELNMLLNGSSYMNINKTFDTTSSLLKSISGTNSDVTMVNLLNNLQTYNNISTPTITYSLSSGYNGFGYKDIYADVDVIATDMTSINILWNNTSSIQPLAPTIIATFSATQSNTYVRFDELDLFMDENISMTTKLADIEKLSNVFTDYTNSFTIPATPNNSKIMKHYYNLDIDNTFNANIRVLAYIEVSTLPFRYGKIQLESVTLKDNRPASYKITFYGGLTQLNDLFGDDELWQLDMVKNSNLDYELDANGNWVQTLNNLSQFNYENNPTNFFKLTGTDPTYMNGDLIIPLVNNGHDYPFASTTYNRVWNYGDGSINDIAAHAIRQTELRPSLRVVKIIEAIEKKYKISFTRNFFGKAVFNNLYMWLNRDMNKNIIKFQPLLIFNALVDTPPITSITSNVSIANDYQSIDGEIYTQGLLKYYKRWSWSFLPSPMEYGTPFTIRIVDEHGVVVKEESYDNNSVMTQTITIYRESTIPAIIGDSKNESRKYRILIAPEYTANFRCIFLGEYGTIDAVGTVSVLEKKWSFANNQDIHANNNISDMIPKLKVVDFITGLMKMFKLMIRPITSTSFYVNTFDGYYGDGNVLNITDFTSIEDITIERPLLYKTLKFKYSKTEAVEGKYFRDFINDPVYKEIGYGDLKAKYNSISNNDELSIELPFENMLFERQYVQAPNILAGNLTNFNFGQAVAVSTIGKVSTIDMKPILFFSNGLVNVSTTPISFNFFKGLYTSDILGGGSKVYVVQNCNDTLLAQITDTINFGAENDSWHQTEIDNSLYLNYWSNTISTIYDLKQRKINFTAHLPERFVRELSVNDRIIIGDDRYKINDYTINLMNGQTTFNLFKDIYSWNYITYPFRFNGVTLTSGWSLTDNIDGLVYGSFNDVNGVTYKKIVRLLDNGSIDTSFNPGSGFDSNTYAYNSITKYNSNEFIVTGDFTTYNGLSYNGIIKIKSDGSISGGFSIGSGFNYVSSGSSVDVDGNIVVVGSFTDYNGHSSSRIIRLKSDGSVDTSFHTGSGFDNNAYSVYNDTTSSRIYVTGVFTSYDGVVAKGIIKLDYNGAVDTSFSASLNPTLLNGLIPYKGGIYCYGDFNDYNGISVGGLVKINGIDGTIDSDFALATNHGFDSGGYPYLGKSVFGDKLLLQGGFTSFNGITAEGGIVLNSDGSIFFAPQIAYENYYFIGNKLYANKTNGPEELLFNNNEPVFSITNINMNTGSKYFGIEILKNKPWQVVGVVDLTSSGTSWVTIDTLNGVGISEFLIFISSNSGTARRLNILIEIDNIIYGILVSQEGV